MYPTVSTEPPFAYLGVAEHWSMYPENYFDCLGKKEKHIHIIRPPPQFKNPDRYLYIYIYYIYMRDGHNFLLNGSASPSS